jgi:hypothetical protein
LALSGHHFIRYARQIADALESESRKAVRFMDPGFVPRPEGQSSSLVQIKERELHRLTG